MTDAKTRILAALALLAPRELLTLAHEAERLVEEGGRGFFRNWAGQRCFTPPDREPGSFGGAS